MAPGPGDPLGGLGWVRGDDVDVALMARSAHGHVGKFASPAVRQGVGGVYGGPLGTVRSEGEAVAELVDPDVFWPHVQFGALRGDGH